VRGCSHCSPVGDGYCSSTGPVGHCCCCHGCPSSCGCSGTRLAMPSHAHWVNLAGYHIIMCQDGYTELNDKCVLKSTLRIDECGPGWIGVAGKCVREGDLQGCDALADPTTSTSLSTNSTLSSSSTSLTTSSSSTTTLTSASSTTSSESTLGSSTSSSSTTTATALSAEIGVSCTPTTMLVTVQLGYTWVAEGSTLPECSFPALESPIIVVDKEACARRNDTESLVVYTVRLVPYFAPGLVAASVSPLTAQCESPKQADAPLGIINRSQPEDAAVVGTGSFTTELLQFADGSFNGIVTEPDPSRYFLEVRAIDVVDNIKVTKVIASPMQNGDGNVTLFDDCETSTSGTSVDLTVTTMVSPVSNRSSARMTMRSFKFDGQNELYMLITSQRCHPDDSRCGSCDDDRRLEESVSADVSHLKVVIQTLGRTEVTLPMEMVVVNAAAHAHWNVLVCAFAAVLTSF